MRHKSACLLLITLTLLLSCAQEYDEPNFEIQVENTSSSGTENNVSISGQLRDASAISVTLEAPLIQSKGKKRS